MAAGQGPDTTAPTVSSIQLAPAAPELRSAPAVSPPLARSRGGAYERSWKRASDLVLGSVLLVLLLPLIALVAAAVLLISGWPVLYGSDRKGAGGGTFRMWKFRTMVTDADVQREQWRRTHPRLAVELAESWKVTGDPRITALGRFLRRSSLDELPQFWNVLRGEMSLVGPRPYLSREQLDPVLAEAILRVRPGLTGPFQVRGRNGISPQMRMEVEAAYTRKVRLLSDAGYLLRTAAPLLHMDGR